MAKRVARPQARAALEAVRTDDVSSLEKALAEQPLLLDWSNPHGNCLLASAIKAGSRDAVSFLIEAGADVRRTNEGGASILDRAVLAGDEHAATLVMAHGATIAVRHWAGLGRRDHLASLPLSMLEETDCRLELPLHWASRRGSLTVIEFLLERQVTIDPLNKNAMTPLALAIEGGHVEASGVLIGAGADVDALGGYSGGRILHRAVIIRSLPLVELLLECGADINRQDRVGKTAVHDAVMVGRLDILETLLAAEPDLSLRTQRLAQQPGGDERAVDMARRRGRDRMVDRLASAER